MSILEIYKNSKKFHEQQINKKWKMNFSITEFNYKEEFENIKSCKAIHYGFNKDFDTTVQPRYNMVEYADDFGMDSLSNKGKKNIKVAQKQNLDIQFGHKELLDDFDKVMKCTEERKGISLRTKEYYELLLDTYKDDAFITLAYFHIHDMLNAYVKSLVLRRNKI